MPNSLNPNNLADINAVLHKTTDEQLYFFLDDSIPNDNKKYAICIIYEKEQQPTEGILTDIENLICSITDTAINCTLNGDRETVTNMGLEYLDPYIPLLRHCYRPYCWELSVTNLTPKQIKTLKDIRTHKLCVIMKQQDVPEGIDTVPATVKLIIGSIQETAEVVICKSEAIAQKG